MKHGKRLTRSQKNFLSKLNLNPDNWLAVKNTSEIFEIVHKASGETKIFDKTNLRGEF